MNNYIKPEKRKNVMHIILIYVAFSVTGLLFLKIGTTKSFSLENNKGVFILKISFYLIIGLIFYLLALLTSLIAMKTLDLSIFYPISAGLAYLLVCLLSFLILKESISKEQLIGMGFILIGVILMNIGK